LKVGVSLGLVIALFGSVAEARADEADGPALAAAAVAWQPTRAADAPLLRVVAAAAIGACADLRDPLPDRGRCPSLILALAFRESSWRPDVVGRRGPLGLMQVHGRATEGKARREVLDPETNVRLGARWLDRCAALCREDHARDAPGFAERVLSAYTGLGCVRSRGARMTLAWTDRIHALVGR
jgi:hypothetical protein